MKGSQSPFPVHQVKSACEERRDIVAEPASKRRKFGDCKRIFHKECELDYLVSYDSKSDTLECKSTLDTPKKYTYVDTTKKCILTLLTGVEENESFLLNNKSLK